MRRIAAVPRSVGLSIALVSFCRLVAQDASAADEPEAPPSEQIVIPDEPRAIDPASIVPERLARRATVEFTDASLNDVVGWLREEQGISTLVETTELQSAGISLGEPVSEQLDDEPLYLLLNRLRSIGVAWSYQDDVVRLTTPDVVAERVRTQPYHAGDLFDAGYNPDELIDTVRSAVDEPWGEVDGIGGDLQVLGDVLFVRQSERGQRKVAALLAALRNHGRRTFVLDEPQHFALREKLDTPVSVDWNNLPLVQAVGDLAQQTGARIRLDVAEFREHRVREREPVSLTLARQPLRVVLDVVLGPLELDWILSDGVLWITSADRAERSLKAAVFDVRDLSRDAEESEALLEAVTAQTNGPWEDTDGIGGTIVFPQPGTMVVLHTERELDAVLRLLEDYRTALRGSKRRTRTGEDPNEVVTRYYRLQARMAADVARTLPLRVQPGTWKDDDHPDAMGTVLQLASASELRDAQGKEIVAADEQRQAGRSAMVVDYAVLIVEHTRAAHHEIAQFLEKVERGDARETTFTGGGFGGGGFGGGFFSTPGRR